MDENSNIVHNDNREVTFQAEGAVIIGPVKIHAEAGIATVLVRTLPSASEVTISVAADGLIPDTVKIQIP
jgi:hypothetical protein